MWRVILGRDIEENLLGSKGVTMDNFSILVKWWWKMTISHLKHGYLNEKWIFVGEKYCSFSFFLNFLNLASLIFVWTQSNFSSAWHDNQFFFFFFCSHDSSTPSNNVCHRWPSRLKHHSSCENCFERVGFWFEVACIISVQRKDMTQKYSRENGQFLVNVPWGINRGDFRASRSWDLCVLVIEKVWHV